LWSESIINTCAKQFLELSRRVDKDGCCGSKKIAQAHYLFENEVLGIGVVSLFFDIAGEKYTGIVRTKYVSSLANIWEYQLTQSRMRRMQ
jgi:hypothetical protein